jgi:hypothetical protein
MQVGVIVNIRCDGDSDIRREFHEFKLQETAKKGKKQREDQVNELKSFSESLKKKDLEQPRSPRSPLKSMSGEFVREGSARPAVTQDVKSSLAPPTPMLSTAVSAPSPSAVPLPTGLGAPVKQLSGSSDSSGPPSASGPLVAPSSVPPPISFSAQLPSSAVVPPGQLVLSPTLSRSSSSASVASNGGAAASKKSSLNPNAKEFKLNPNAKAFTPSFSSPRPASPMMQSPIYMHASLPPATSLQGVPLQYMQQQPVQSAQFTQYHNAMAAAAAAAASGAGPYMQQPGGFVSGFPGGGMPQVIPGQPSMKIPAHSQQQVVSPFGQQQQIRYPSQAPPMQPAFLHPNGQLYPPTQMMLAHPGQLMYIQHYPQVKLYHLKTNVLHNGFLSLSEQYVHQFWKLHADIMPNIVHPTCMGRFVIKGLTNQFLCIKIYNFFWLHIIWKRINHHSKLTLVWHMGGKKCSNGL